MNSPIIAVAPHTDVNQFNSRVSAVPLAYTDAIERAGGISFILPFTTKLDDLHQVLAHADGVLLPGGFDLDPEFFHQEPDPALGKVERALDLFQMKVVALALEHKMPILGICRGAQVINVAMGGTLYQDIPTHFPKSALKHMQTTLSFDTDHGVSFSPGSRLYECFGPEIEINSRHHQSIKDVGKDLTVTAISPDGVIEAAQHNSLPVDLIQWHPELMMQKNDDMLPLFQSFVNSCYKKA